MGLSQIFAACSRAVSNLTSSEPSRHGSPQYAFRHKPHHKNKPCRPSKSLPRRCHHLNNAYFSASSPTDFNRIDYAIEDYFKNPGHTSHDDGPSVSSLARDMDRVFALAGIPVGDSPLHAGIPSAAPNFSGLFNHDPPGPTPTDDPAYSQPPHNRPDQASDEQPHHITYPVPGQNADISMQQVPGATVYDNAERQDIFYDADGKPQIDYYYEPVPVGTTTEFREDTNYNNPYQTGNQPPAIFGKP